MRFSDIRTYLKFLSRNKLYTFVSVMGFSVSMMFVVILAAYTRQELSFDDFHENGDRIFMIMNEENANTGNPIGQYAKDRIPEVEMFTRYTSRSVSIEKEKGSIFLSEVSYADPDFFKIFSFELILGNTDDVLVREKTVAISESMANRLFGTENPIGQTVMIDQDLNTVTGVFRDFPYNTHFKAPDFLLNYLSLSRMWEQDPDGPLLTTWDNFGFRAYFMAYPGTDINSKRDVLLEDFRKDVWTYEDGRRYKDVMFTPLKDLHFDSRLNGDYDIYKTSDRTTIKVYIAVAFLILVFAVLNYINTTAAQSSFRGKETAVKKLLGSARGRIVGQLLGESALMTSFSFLVALCFAFLAEPLFNDMLGTQLSLAGMFTASGIALILVSIAVLSVIAGLVPAVLISRFKPIEVIKGTFKRRGKGSYSAILGVFQYTVSIMLLICSVFILRQSNFLRNNDMGMDLHRAYYIENVIWRENFSFEPVKSELLAISGVEKVSLTRGIPGIDGNNNSFVYNDIPIRASVYIVDTMFFDILDIRITPLDFPVNNRKVYLNRVIYNAMQPDKTEGQIEKWGEQFSVAGLLSDFNEESLHSAIGMIWIEILPEDFYPWQILIKISDNADLLSTVKAIDSTYAKFTEEIPFTSGFVEEKLQEWYEKEKRTASMMTAFTVLAIVIMITGVFAMSLYSVRQREKEIGLRKVNGATVGEILRLLNRRSSVIVFVSFVIACPIAFFAMERWLRQFAYRIGLSLWVFFLSWVIVLTLTVICVTLQSLRTARMNPVDTLKSE